MEGGWAGSLTKLMLAFDLTGETIPDATISVLILANLLAWEIFGRDHSLAGGTSYLPLTLVTLPQHLSAAIPDAPLRPEFLASASCPNDEYVLLDLLGLGSETCRITQAGSLFSDPSW